MATIIHLKPESIWDFYKANESRLNREMVLIAENTDPDEKVFLSCEDTLPYVYFFKNGKRICSEGMVSYLDAKTTTLSYYEKFSPSKEEKPKKAEKTVGDLMDDIYEREDALDLALRDFLEVVLQRNEVSIRAIDVNTFTDVLEDVLSVIAEHGFPIYRPMFIADDDTGSELLVEYPYAT